MHLFSSFSGPPPPLLQQYDHQQLHPHHQGHTTRLPSLGGHYYLSHGDVGIHYSFSVRDRFYFSADLLLSVTRTTRPAPQLYFPLLRFNSFPQSRFPVFGVSPITILRLARSPSLLPSSFLQWALRLSPPHPCIKRCPLSFPRSIIRSPVP